MLKKRRGPWALVATQTHGPEELPSSLHVRVDAGEATKIVARFLRDYLDASSLKGYLVGLSGGLDSAVSGALAVKSVGADRVAALVLPEDSTPERDLSDAATVAKSLGIGAETISIQPLVDAFMSIHPRASPREAANAKARMRMILLHAHAQAMNRIVLGTGNKSELLTGYFTKYGDGGVDVQPLGDLYKTQVRALAKSLAIPESIVAKAPSAGLMAGQTDEEDLGLPYDVLDRILLGLELRLAPEVISRIVNVDASHVARIEGLRRTTQHKRRTPLSPKMGFRTPGLDWRTPTMEA